MTIPLAAILSASCATTSVSPVSNYRALGTEPFWSLRVGSTKLNFEEANAPDAPVEQTIDHRYKNPDGSSFTGSPRLKIWTRPVRCNDGMSDRFFPDEVVVLVDNRRFEGCGGEPFSGTEAA